jgi:hypothetical protein
VRLSYNPTTHRRCICCPNSGQPPLRRILIDEDGSAWPTRAVTLECGHLESPIWEFRQFHPEWVWDALPS